MSRHDLVLLSQTTLLRIARKLAALCPSWHYMAQAADGSGDESLQLFFFRFSAREIGAELREHGPSTHRSSELQKQAALSLVAA